MTLNTSQGNSLIRGPTDVVTDILSSVSPAFAANTNAAPTLSCDSAHTLAFEIGGKLFSVDPRDFLSQQRAGNATACVASSVVSTDPPSFGALFRWSLGDPFLKSNLVAFYYGNLTHPSVDPPRIGFLSMVPSNASALLDGAVTDASDNGGNFEGACASDLRLACILTARTHRDIDGGANMEHGEVLRAVDHVYFCSTHVEYVSCTQEHPEPDH